MVNWHSRADELTFEVAKVKLVVLTPAIVER